MQYCKDENGVFDMHLKGLKKKVDDMFKFSVPFNERQAKLLKEVADGKWNALTKKVAGINDEVFAKVMETEMAIARLETESISKAFPKNSVSGKENKSLLRRLTTFKNLLQQKQKSKERPKFDDSDSFDDDDDDSHYSIGDG